MMNPKTEGRIYAFKFLYQVAFSGEIPSLEDWESQLEEFDLSSRNKEEEDLPLGPKAKTHGRELLKKVFPELDSFTNEIPPFLKSGKLKTLSDTERALLMLAYYELKFEAQTPFKVVFNEYINLAKKFGQQRSADLINGILENMAKKLGRKDL